MWYVYMLECEDNSIYVGIAQDVEQRFGQHQLGIGGHYTAFISRPTKILYTEKFRFKLHAENREIQIKKWTREKKLALAHGNLERLKSLSISRD